MRSRFWLIALAGLAALLALPLLLESDEERILAQLERLRVLAEIEPAESGIQQLTRTREIARHFTARTVYDLTNAGHGVVEIPTRQELEQTILSARNRILMLEIGLDEPEAAIDGDTARVRVTGTGTWALRSDQGRFLDIHTVEVLFHRQDGHWLISGARHLRNERLPH